MTEQIPSYSREEYEKTKKEEEEKKDSPARERVKITQRLSDLEDLAWGQALEEDEKRKAEKQQGEQAKEKAEKLPVKVKVIREEDKNTTSGEEERLREFMLEYNRLLKEQQKSIKKERQIKSEYDPKSENYDSLLGFLSSIEDCTDGITLINDRELGIFEEMKNNPEMLKRSAMYFMYKTPAEPIREIASNVRHLLNDNNNKTYGTEVIDKINGFTKFYQKSPEIIKQVLKDHQEIVIEQLNAEIKKLEPLTKSAYKDLYDKRFKTLNYTLERENKNHEKLRESIKKLDETPLISSILVKAIEHTIDLERQKNELKERLPDVEEEARKEYIELKQKISTEFSEEKRLFWYFYAMLENLKRNLVSAGYEKVIGSEHLRQHENFERSVLSRRDKGKNASNIYHPDDIKVLEGLVNYYKESLEKFKRLAEEYKSRREALVKKQDSAKENYDREMARRELEKIANAYLTIKKNIEAFENIPPDQFEKLVENHKSVNENINKRKEIEKIYPDIDKSVSS